MKRTALTIAALAITGLVACTPAPRTSAPDPEPADLRYAPQESIAEVRVLAAASRYYKMDIDTGPRSNVRTEDLRELFANHVEVMTYTIQRGRPLISITYYNPDGRVMDCITMPGGGGDYSGGLRWSAQTLRGPDGQVWPFLSYDYEGRSRPGIVGSSPIYDAGTGELAMFTYNKVHAAGWTSAGVSHLQKRLPRAVYIVCPDFPAPGALGIGVNEAQTATTYSELVAQDPGRRVLRPDLVTPHSGIVARYAGAAE